MKLSAKRNHASGLERIHREKIRSRKAQIRARALGKPYNGFCLADHVAPEVLRRPLNLSGVEIPEDHEE